MAEITALARLEESTRGLITDPAVLTARIREWQQHAHVLSPVVLSALPPQYAASAALIVLDTSVDRKGIGPEIYGVPAEGRGVPWLSAGEAAIGKVGLNRIAQAAGVTWDPLACGRTDDRKERYYWEYKAVGSYVGCDGTKQTIVGTFELDLRDGSPNLKGFTPSQIDATRKSGLRLCESKAMNAAIRELGIRQKYSLKDLQKPFVVVRMAFQPDMKDPMQRRLVAERGMAGAGALYPNARQIGVGRSDDIVIEPERVETVDTPNGKVDTGTGEIVDPAQPTNGAGTVPTPAAAGSTPPPSDPPEPPSPKGPIILDRRTRDGKTASGKPYTHHWYKLDDGRELHTFRSEVDALARTLMAEKAPVDVVAQQGKYEALEIVELRRSQPSLPMGDDVSDSDLAARY